jgi:hypothetical protein
MTTRCDGLSTTVASEFMNHDPLKKPEDWLGGEMNLTRLERV